MTSKWCFPNGAGARISPALFVLVALTTTACSHNADTRSTPSASPSQVSPTVATTSSSGGNDPYTTAQRAEYQDALNRWNAYERESAPLWADPRPTPATLRFFQSYFYAAQVYQQRLSEYQSAGIKVTGHETVLQSEPILIKGDAVSISQCVDYTTLHVTVKGVASPSAKTPLQRVIYLSRPPGQAFLVSRVKDVASGDKARPCRA